MFYRNTRSASKPYVRALNELAELENGKHSISYDRDEFISLLREPRKYFVIVNTVSIGEIKY